MRRMRPSRSMAAIRVRTRSGATPTACATASYGFFCVKGRPPASRRTISRSIAA
jgi:hypothetical protein